MTRCGKWSVVSSQWTKDGMKGGFQRLDGLTVRRLDAFLRPLDPSTLRRGGAAL